MHARQDPEDLQDHRADQGLPDPLLGGGRHGERRLTGSDAPVDISIPAESVYVGIVRLALGSLARSAGFDEERVDDIRIAVSEACANAVLSDQDAGAEQILVSWREEPERVVVEVGDSRAGGAEPAAGPADSQGFASRMVMSVALLKEMADDLAFEPRSGGGTTTRLVFSRS